MKNLFDFKAGLRGEEKSTYFQYETKNWVFRTFKSFLLFAVKMALKAAMAAIFIILPRCSRCSEVFRFKKTEHLAGLLNTG
jgi:hypothetical protein